MHAPCNELFSTAPTFNEPTFLDVASQLGHLRDVEQHFGELEDVSSSIMRELARLEKITRDFRFSGLVGTWQWESLKSPIPDDAVADRNADYINGHATDFQSSDIYVSPATDTDLPARRESALHEIAPRDSAVKMADDLSAHRGSVSSERGHRDSDEKMSNLRRAGTTSTKWDSVVEMITCMENDSPAPLHHSRHFCRRCVRNTWKNKRVILDMFIGIVIVLNAITIGISFDLGSPSLWLVMETIFAIIFLLEIFSKVLLMGCREFLLGEEKYWNMFEFLLVIAGCFEVVSALALAEDNETMNMLGLTRMLKVARVARLVRLIRFDFFKELLLMLTGTVGGLRTLFWSFVLISWPLYVACLIFRQTLGEDSGETKEYFASVPMSFFTVFRCLVPGECTDTAGRPIFYQIVRVRGFGFAIAYIGLVMLMQFGLFNVIIAIFVENVMIAARSDSERVRKHRRQNQEFFNGKMTELFNRIWELHLDMCKEKGIPIPNVRPSKPTMKVTIERLQLVKITENLFDRLLADRKAKEIFQDLEVADDDQVNLFEMLDADGSGTLEVPELYMGISKLRGPAQRSDLITNQLLLRTLVDRHKSERNTIEKVFLSDENQTAHDADPADRQPNT